MEPPPRALHHPPYASGGGGGGSGGREDCWSEGATEALVEAWGDRYLQLSRGNLRQKDWKEVAEAVNEHLDALGRPRKTDIQCKNRIDTLKKKYKLEKSKIGPSQWPLFSRVNELIGPGPSSKPHALASGNKKPLPQAAPVLKPHTHPTLTFTVKQRPRSNLNPAVYSGGSSSRSRMNSPPASTESSHGESGAGRDDDDTMGENDDDDDEDEDGGAGLFRGTKVGPAKRRRLEDLVDAGVGGDDGVEGAFVELARAIIKFGEIYEKVESSKQQQMMELERQRMEFAKELEFQRMQMFMEAQLDLEKVKRPKYASGAGKGS